MIKKTLYFILFVAIIWTLAYFFMEALIREETTVHRLNEALRYQMAVDNTTYMIHESVVKEKGRK